MDTTGLGGKGTRRRTTGPSFGPLWSNAGPQFDATTRDRHIIAVDVVRRYAVTILPETIARRSAALEPIALKRSGAQP